MKGRRRKIVQRTIPFHMTEFTKESNTITIGKGTRKGLRKTQWTRQNRSRKARII
jgi:hypothetical protein